MQSSTTVPAKKAWEEVPKPVRRRRHRRDRARRCRHHLRHRPSHPEGRRSRGDRRAHPRPRGGRHRRGGRLGREERQGRATACSCRASPRAARAGTAVEGSYGQCLGGGGWILGHKIDGTQAEYVRVPFADTSTYPVPAGVSDEQILMLADILPTGYEVGVLNGKVRPGDVVADRRGRPDRALGDDGRAAVQPGARRGDRPGRQPPRGRQAVRRRHRREQQPRGPARRRPRAHRRARRRRRHRGGRHAGDLRARDRSSRDPAGTSPTSACTAKPATLHLEDLWIRNVTITTGLVDTYSTPTLLRLAQGHQIDAGPVRHPPLHPRSVRGGVRRVRPCRRHRRAQGGAHPGVTDGSRPTRCWAATSAGKQRRGSP